MGARHDIATAAATAAGVTCTPYYRQSLNPGDGFVRLGSRSLDGSGLGYLDTWQVWIALHQDIEIAERWIDEHVDQVIAALSPVLHVNTVTPSEFALGGPTVPGVIFEGVCESS